MRLKTCGGCGLAFQPRTSRQRRCESCTPAGRDDRSPTTRAQDAEYQRERARVLKPVNGRAPRCALRIKCVGAVATTVDHIRPVARGGRHRGNLQPACAACNAAKQDNAPPSGTRAALDAVARTALGIVDETHAHALPAANVVRTARPAAHVLTATTAGMEDAELGYNADGTPVRLA